MPETPEPVFYYANGQWWIEHRMVLAPTHEERVQARLAELREQPVSLSRPFAFHEPGECVECDAIRAREAELP